VSPNFAAFYGGLRASFLVVDLRGGVRRVVGIAHSFAPAAPAHTLDDFEGATKASYTALELELSGGLPAPFGIAFWDAEWIGLRGVPDGYDVYEEWIKVAARPPSVAAGRVAWLAQLGREEQFLLGPLADFTATIGPGPHA